MQNENLKVRTLTSWEWVGAHSLVGSGLGHTHWSNSGLGHTDTLTNCKVESVISSVLEQTASVVYGVDVPGVEGKAG